MLSDHPSLEARPKPQRTHLRQLDVQTASGGLGVWNCPRRAGGDLGPGGRRLSILREFGRRAWILARSHGRTGLAPNRASAACTIVDGRPAVDETAAPRDPQDVPMSKRWLQRITETIGTRNLVAASLRDVEAAAKRCTSCESVRRRSRERCPTTRVASAVSSLGRATSNALGKGRVWERILVVADDAETTGGAAQSLLAD